MESGCGGENTGEEGRPRPDVYARCGAGVAFDCDESLLESRTGIGSCILLSNSNAAGRSAVSYQLYLVVKGFVFVFGFCLHKIESQLSRDLQGLCDAVYVVADAGVLDS
jgi:hypothetical protein